MTTSELIALLQKADPEGSRNVTVRGVDIYWVSPMPGYYDGYYEQLVRDPKDATKINAVRLTRKGEKLMIYTAPADEIVIDDPSIPVEIDDSITNAASLRSMVDHWRAIGRGEIEE